LFVTKANSHKVIMMANSHKVIMMANSHKVIMIDDGVDNDLRNLDKNSSSLMFYAISQFDVYSSNTPLGPCESFQCGGQVFSTLGLFTIRL